jgi:hypothetical protein
MSKSKFVAMLVLIVFAVGIFLMGEVVAGEKFKCRTVWHSTKWNPINVGDEKDHVVALGENKGIVSNREGKTFGEGWLAYGTSILDISPKTGATGNGYDTYTDKDGDKIYMKWAAIPTGPNPWTFFKGTGKFLGVNGKGTWSVVFTADPTQWYADWEGEIELPR